jgi:hypothetical protein
MPNLHPIPATVPPNRTKGRHHSIQDRARNFRFLNAIGLRLNALLTLQRTCCGFAQGIDFDFELPQGTGFAVFIL